jgi:putative acetyltransferase
MLASGAQPTILGRRVTCSVVVSATIQDLDLRRATEADIDAMADAHVDSILRLGSQFYASAIVNEWARVVNPGLYLQAMGRREVFFIATGAVDGRPMVLGFSSDYVIDGTTHGTSAYVRPVAARRRVGSRLLRLAESFGKARGATAVQIEASLGAVEFYKRHGFIETERGDVALPSGFRMPCVFMRKELP